MNSFKKKKIKEDNQIYITFIPLSNNIKEERKRLKVPVTIKK